MATSSSDTILDSTISEKTWVDQTRKKLVNATPLDETTPISVCHVPKFISVINPQAYTPQVIALGPYHYLRSELYHMERYKIETVKSHWERDQITLVVQNLQEIGPKVRACYHKYLDIEDDTLALMLAIDGLFLIYLLSKHLNGFTDDASIFRDVMMLENQIPMIILKEIENTIGSNDLFSKMRVFCEAQSPFVLNPDHHQDLQESEVLHLLNLLHEMITMHETSKLPDSAGPREVTKASRQESIALKIDRDHDPLIENAIGIFTSKAASSIKPIKVITGLPWEMISNLLSHSSGVKEVANKNPLVQEIDIPSVSKLSKLAGILFQPETGGNLQIRLDSKAGILYLPVITLNGNSEVILRNLVAYEMASSCSTSGHHNLVLAQYVDLMSGIIDTKEDASLLQRAGIIKGDLSNSQVADLFNGMNKSSQKVYNETAAKINDYYRHKPKVKAYRFVRKYFYESWKVLTVISTIVLLLLMILQSVCSVYDCKQVIKMIINAHMAKWVDWWPTNVLQIADFWEKIQKAGDKDTKADVCKVIGVAFLKMELNSILNANLSKQRWVDQISKNFKDEVGVDVSEVPVCVFNVPKSITRFKPEAYVPQAIALGPYHHFESHLYQMERYKVAVVKAFLNPDQVLAFEPLVIDRLRKIEPIIRACYHKYLDLDDDTLAWIIAIDGLFLLNLFRNHGELERFIPKKLLNYAVLYRDIMVLENQMPLMILNEIRKILDRDINNGDCELLSMLRGFCEVHSPLKLSRDLDYSVEKASSYLHLLDLMYNLIVNHQSPKEDSEEESWHPERDDDDRQTAKKHHVIGNMGAIMELGEQLGKVRRVGKAINVIISIPWDKISSLLGFGKKGDKDDGDDHPRVTEIEIPSVLSLSKYARINFNRTNGGIRDTKFVASEATLYLPVITLDTYSEVVLRNLVAYEAATARSDTELAQFVDLMSGIIDHEEDARLLKGKGIIEGNMTNKEIAHLFNGMNKSNVHARSNETVEQLNEYYNGRLAIKAWKFMKKRMRGSRKAMTIVLTIFACLLMIVYSFCEVYGCPKLFNKIT
ncbi:hypothetical protein OSB04_015065 [Centaurea solstitialis]|uniref:Uncharacterized protein n=1 Tax=Centaurea solstitialis TaxID=347529 RepID=A0AA38TA92_9ASTR|nr:hypothetical protein OSB04_015065 [Centaurea solstitialis]